MERARHDAGRARSGGATASLGGIAMQGQRLTTNSEIADRLEIEDLLTRYCRAIDALDWSLLDTVFVADAFIDYTSSGGVQGRYPEVRDWLARILPAFPVRQHLVTNLQIRVDGDRATSRAYFYNPMGRPQPDGTVKLFFVGGDYVDDLIRTEAGWRITRRIEHQLWVDIRP